MEVILQHVSAMHCCIIFKNSAILVSTDRILFLVFAAPLISDFHGKTGSDSAMKARLCSQTLQNRTHGLVKN